MTWVLLALTAAFCTAGRDVLIKHTMGPGDEAAVSFAMFLTAAALLLPLALMGGARVHATSFWPALLVSGGINVGAALMIARAVHVSDLSLVAPLQSTTPLFMIPVGWLILGEMPGPAGAGGIALFAGGAYLLGVLAAPPRGTAAPGIAHAGVAPAARAAVTHPRQPNLGAAALRPLRRLADDRGARLMIAVAALYAVSGSVDKVGVAASHPLLWAGALCTFVAIGLGALLTRHPARLPQVAGRARGRLLLAGAIMALGLAAQMTALALTAAAFVIAVKRSSILISVVAGGVVFREAGASRRLLAAAIMLAGILLLGSVG